VTKRQHGAANTFGESNPKAAADQGIRTGTQVPIITHRKTTGHGTMKHIVGDTYHNTNRSVLVAGPEITLRPVGARQFVAGSRR
jgi:hypothetical protein